MKYRPIDDMSASWIKAATVVTEKLAYDTLDKYYALMKIMEECVEVWQPRMNSAYLVGWCLCGCRVQRLCTRQTSIQLFVGYRSYLVIGDMPA